MKALYFDCFSGISGDMTLGALLDVGVDEKLLRKELDKLGLNDEFELECKRINKYGITGTDVTVKLNNDHHHHHARNLKDIMDIIEESTLSFRVKEISGRTFREVAQAEAKVHGKLPDEVHFHEVGATDSIVDIVGSAVCIDLLGIERIYSSALHDGKGFVDCQHGRIPVPVPAVMEMLKDSKIPLITEDINTELVTPTGLALIKTAACQFGNMPAIIIDRVGYGMGKRETGRLNALRVVMGELFNEEDALEEIAMLETNIDDMTPEVMGYTMERLLRKGALDVFYTPVYMKKSRPAYMLTVLGHIEDEDRLADLILRETTTLGVRKSRVKRKCLERRTEKYTTEYGEVRVKIATGGDFTKVSPEYEDLRKIAVEKGIPLYKVFDDIKRRVDNLK